MLTGMCGLCLGAYGLLDGSGARFARLAGPARRVGALRRRPGRREPPRAAQPVPARPVAAARVDRRRLAGWCRPSSSWPGRLRPWLASTRRRTRCVWPTLPVVPALAILFAAVAAVAAPPPLRPVAAPGRRGRLGDVGRVDSRARPSGAADTGTAGRGAGVIELRPGDRHLRRRRPRRCCETCACGSTRASWRWSSDGPGVGKSTLLGAVNGLVPHFTGGTLAGRVTVDGRDTAHPPTT